MQNFHVKVIDSGLVLWLRCATRIVHREMVLISGLPIVEVPRFVSFAECWSPLGPSESIWHLNNDDTGSVAAVSSSGR